MTYFNFFLCKSFLCLFLAMGGALGADRVGLTVFIHGTVGSSLSVVGGSKLSGDILDESSTAARSVIKFRNHPLMGYDHICGAEGFHAFMPLDISKVRQTEACQYLIPAYDNLMKVTDAQGIAQNYAIFGWSGLLHNAARKKAGYELYQELCAYRDRMVNEHGIEPEITIVAHSHGGNVALYMAQAEREQQKKLNIKHVVMFGSPMMCEMAQCVRSNMFETIIMVYSKGDSVQPRDMFSSKKGKSYQRMADIVDTTRLQGKRYDVCCVVDGNNKTITHTNMWFVGRSTAISESMNLLPLMVVTPAIIACVHKASEHSDAPYVFAELHMRECGALFECCLAPYNQTQRFYAKNQDLLKQRLLFWDTAMRDRWQLQDDRYRHPVFNKKIMKITRSIAWG